MLMTVHKDSISNNREKKETVFLKRGKKERKRKGLIDFSRIIVAIYVHTHT